MTYQIHPVAELFPMIEGEAFAALVADIQANGLIEPIVLIGNVIVDGRNRLKACEAAGVTPRYREVESSDPVAYIISTNLHRRHLTTAQRAIIAEQLATMKVGNPTGSNQHSGGIGPNGPIPKTEISISQAAKLMNVSEKSVKRARQRKAKDPNAHEAIKRGEKMAKPEKTEKPEKQVEEDDKMNRAMRTDNRKLWKKVAIEAYQSTTGKIMSFNWVEDHLKPYFSERAPWVKEIHGNVNISDEQAEEITRMTIEYANQHAPDCVEKQSQAIAGTAAETAAHLQGKEVTALDRAIAAHKRVLESQLEERIKERLQSALDMYVKEYDRCKAINSAWKGFLTDDEYRLIISCLHPDRAPTDRVKQYEKAFHIVKSKEDIFLAAKKDPNESTMPRTVADLMARRNQH